MGESEQKKKGPGRQNEVYEWLESAIFETKLNPGDFIDEQELCKKFDVSRTPVREALLQLASRDLVVFLPRKGAMVTRLSVQEIVPMWEVLTGLEVMCAELATRRMTAEERKNLEQTHRESEIYVEREQADKFSISNRTFHEIIHQGARNPYLTSEIRQLRLRLRSYGRRPYQRPGGLKTSFLGHAEIVEATKRGDEAVVREAMQRHVSGGLALMDFLAEAASIRIA